MGEVCDLLGFWILRYKYRGPARDNVLGFVVGVPRRDIGWRRRPGPGWRCSARASEAPR